MKLVNEAYGELSDEKTRAEYDRVSRKNQGSNCNGRDLSSSVIRSLKQKLAESESKQGMLKKKIVNLQGENCEIRGNLAQFKLSLYEKTSQNKQLQHKQKKIENEVDHLKSEKDLLERENQDQKRQIDVYEEKMDRNSRALMDERRKASDDFARSELKAKQKIEHIKNVTSERSVCYRCNGKSVSKEDCIACNGNGAILGLWTRCHNCDGTGSFTSINGEEKICVVCSSKGAREGIHSTRCFKCKGSGIDCNVCYKGRIRDFNLKLCPLCRGKEIAKIVMGGLMCHVHANLRAPAIK